MRILAIAAATAALSVTACVSTGGSATNVRAPQPAGAALPASFFSGVWHEVARNPMDVTKGCVAAETRFYRDAKGVLIDRDSCRWGTINGREKVFEGPVTILDTATKAKFRTDYRVFGPLTISREYWVLDHGADWFIAATPSFKDLSIFTRGPQVNDARRATLVARARALGYDVGKLEYPAQLPVDPPARV